MSPLWLGKAEPDGKKTRGEATKKSKKERRSGNDRRSGRERRSRRKRDRTKKPLYRDDLDRHLWSWAGSKPSRKKREKATAERKRKFAGVIASAAGALGAAGLSWFLYQKIRQEEQEEDPIARQADLDEADFES
jgi:hypothetical protein